MRRSSIRDIGFIPGFINGMFCNQQSPVTNELCWKPITFSGPSLSLQDIQHLLALQGKPG